MKHSLWMAVTIALVTAGCAPTAPTPDRGKSELNHCDHHLRVATFNVSMEAENYEPQPGDGPAGTHRLRRRLQRDDHPQIRQIAEIIQRVRPDILLLNEFDRIEPPQDGIGRFQRRYLERSQSGQPPLHYPHRFVAPVNTGVAMPVDTNGDGEVTRPEDAYGFGHFPGHYGMAVLSRYPIERDRVRTFQRFLWRDMPGALKPVTAADDPYYSGEAWNVFRLSSKSHWDLPIRVPGQRLHLLASHPTPPVFDGEEDRNGRRNHDEIRLWRDYISDEADYLYDDRGRRGGLPADAFVIAGDLNASPVEGDGRREAIQALLDHPRLHPIEPMSEGGRRARPEHPHSATHTADWGQRADYVLPSRDWTVRDSGVFWPAPDDPRHHLVEERASGSDHRLVWVDLCPGGVSPSD